MVGNKISIAASSSKRRTSRCRRSFPSNSNLMTLSLGQTEASVPVNWRSPSDNERGVIESEIGFTFPLESRQVRELIGYLRVKESSLSHLRTVQNKDIAVRVLRGANCCVLGGSKSATRVELELADVAADGF